MSVSRRDFMEDAFRFVAGLICGLTLGEALPRKEAGAEVSRETFEERMGRLYGPPARRMVETVQGHRPFDGGMLRISPELEACAYLAEKEGLLEGVEVVSKDDFRPGYWQFISIVATPDWYLDRAQAS